MRATDSEGQHEEVLALGANPHGHSKCARSTLGQRGQLVVLGAGFASGQYETVQSAVDYEPLAPVVLGDKPGTSAGLSPMPQIAMKVPPTS